MRRAGAVLVLAALAACGGGVAGQRDDAGADASGAPPCAGPPYPIVLVHGWSGFDAVGSVGYFFEVADDLIARGDVVVTAEVAPYAASEIRAAELAAQVDDALAQTGACKVVVIGHSQGGLDGRVLISQYGYGARVAALVTISTPHRGTRIADVYLGLEPGLTDDLVDFLALLSGRVISDIDEAPDVRDSMETIAEAYAGAFAARNPDDPRVAYYSVAGRSLRQPGTGVCDDGLWGNPPEVDAVDPALVAPGLFLQGDPAAPVVNDGLCTVASAKWGTFLGCVPADHLDEIGQLADENPDPSSGWSHKAFYRRLAAFLREEGF